MRPNLFVSGTTAIPGLFRVIDGEVEQVDGIASSGLALIRGGETGNPLLYRLRFDLRKAVLDRLECPAGEPLAPVSSWEIPGASQAHGLLPDGPLLAMVDTTSNSVLWVDPADGEVMSTWQASTVPDSWHLNSLAYANTGDLVVGSFGRWETSRGWWGHGPDRKGELISVGNGASILTGLAAPHSPVLTPQGWLLTESFASALVLYESDAPEPARSLTLGGWPRGLAVVDGIAWVGVSDSERVPFGMPPHGVTPGKLVAVDIDSWEVLDEIPMPCSAIYDVIEG